VRSRKNTSALIALTMGVLAWPASAGAATVSITGDDGAAQALGGQTIRNMAPQLAVSINGTTEDAYSVSVTGPNGQVQSLATCSSSATPRTVPYVGNGAYTVSIAVYGSFACTTPIQSGTGTFTIAAGVALNAGTTTRVLTRQAGEFATLEHRLPLTGNPGADTYDVVYSGNPALAPDGGLVGPVQNAFVDAATATVPLRFSEPGSYSIVARARVFSGGATPWTAPLVLRAFAPFDFSSASFPDSRGPSYRLRVRLREDSARGRVRIRVAKNWSGRTRYRTIGRVRIRGGGFTKRFTLTRPGKWRIRYEFAGSSTTAPGTVVEKVRIRRTVRFSSADGADHTLLAR
jgi:hypothetical protein